MKLDACPRTDAVWARARIPRRGRHAGDAHLAGQLGIGVQLSAGPEPADRRLDDFGDGSGPALLAAGKFTRAGGIAARNIAQ